MLFLLIIAIILIVFVAMSVKIVRQSEVYIIERLGKFHKIADAGLTIIIPFIDHVRSIVSLKQQTLDVAPQEVITKDNVTITINTVVFYRIMDPAKAVYEIQSLKKGIEYLSVTSIRDLVGKMDLDSTFSSRDTINDKLRSMLDEATNIWGCSIDRVEVQDITPPPDIRDAMEKQMNAERNKRAAILQAEGERQAAVLKAQGEKEAASELGTYYEEFGQYQAAETYLLKASRLGANYAYYNLGHLYMSLDKCELAEKYFNLAIDYGPMGQIDSIHNLNVLLARQMRIKDSIVVLRKGAENYNDPYSQVYLGQILYFFGSNCDNRPSQKDKEEGKKWIEKAAASGDSRAIQILSEIK